jgi:hypothetical protein
MFKSNFGDTESEDKVCIYEAYPIDESNEIVGQWDFEDASDLGKATIGEDLVLFGNPTASTGPKEGDAAVLLGDGDYFRALTNITPRNTNEYVNTYTYKVDIKMDELGWNSLIQMDYVNNHRDGGLFIGSSGKVGKGDIGYTEDGIITAGQWYRLIMTIEEDVDSIAINLYLDGSLILKGNRQSVDSWYALRDSVLFFRDNDGEEVPTDVSQIVLYNYALSSEEISDLGGVGQIPTAVSADKEDVLNSYKLDQNYPNPFNPTTNITLTIPVSGKTTLKVYNVSGQMITTLVDQNLVAGSYKYSFNGTDLPSGIYFYKLQSNNHIEMKKMLLLK